MMGFLIDRGTGTDKLLANLRTAFFENVEDAAASAELFNPTEDLKLSDIFQRLRQRGVIPRSNYDTDFMGWLDDLATRHPGVHNKIRNKMYRHLTTLPLRPMLHDWEECPDTRTDVHVLDDFKTHNRGELICYIRVSTRRVTAARRQQYRRIMKKKAARKKAEKMK